MAGMYSSLGGRRAFEAAVEEFYRRVLADPRLQPYFAGSDLDRLKHHQRAFLAMALGGPRAYLGRALSGAHGRLSIDDEAFDRTMDHLVATLADIGVPREMVREIGANLLPMRHDIVRVPATAAAPAGIGTGAVATGAGAVRRRPTWAAPGAPAAGVPAPGVPAPGGVSLFEPDQ